MLKLVLGLLASAAFTISANAVQIVSFGQTSGTNTVVGDANVAGTQTTITIDDAVVNITQLFGGSPGIADFSLNATSVDPVTVIGSAVIQHYSGTFCLTTAINCGGTNILSGTFTDAAFGGIGGPGLVVNANNPPDQLTLVSAVISPANLQAPSTFNLDFSNLIPPLHVVGQTIADFTASFVGNASASTINVPEPTSMAVLGMGLIGLGIVKRRKFHS